MKITKCKPYDCYSRIDRKRIISGSVSKMSSESIINKRSKKAVLSIDYENIAENMDLRKFLNFLKKENSYLYRIGNMRVEGYRPFEVMRICNISYYKYRRAMDMIQEYFSDYF